VAKKIILGAISFLVAFASMAQDGWLQPNKFRVSAGEGVRVDFVTGENFVGEPGEVAADKPLVVQWFSQSGMQDLSGEAKPTGGSNLILKLPEGTHLLSMKNPMASRNWEPEKFNVYLEENGMETLAGERRKDPGMNRAAKESVTYFTKVLLQSGIKTDAVFKTRVGSQLEIIPDKNPYTLKTGDHLQCLVLVDGKPSPHTLVKVWGRLNRTTFLQNMYTENDGTIRFPVSTKGPWMVSAVKMVPGEKPGNDWHSLWGSLVFGI
jgi:uncharacterized GH25 family protein